MMPFNMFSYINYTKISKEHEQIQQNKQGWPFLPSRDLIVERLTQELSKIARIIFVIFIAPIEYTVSLCSHLFSRVSGHDSLFLILVEWSLRSFM